MMIVLIITESWLYEQFLPFSILSLYIVVYIKQCTYFFFTIFFINNVFVVFCIMLAGWHGPGHAQHATTRRTHRLFFSLVFLVCQNQSIKVFYTIMVYKPILIQCCAIMFFCVGNSLFHSTLLLRLIAISSQQLYDSYQI